jgi:hypothetical protein
MNKQTQEALKMAIGEIQDLMQHIKDRQPDMLFTGTEYVIDACKQALATNKESSLVQPAQEPVAWMSAGRILTDNKEQADWWIEAGGIATPLYTKEQL